MEQVLQELINKQPKLCVLATVSRDGSPESAVVGYAVKDDLTLIFITKKGTRKYTNLGYSHHVGTFGVNYECVQVKTNTNRDTNT